MLETKRRRYTDELKSGTVRLTRESGRPVAQIARELGVSGNVLYRWVAEERHAVARGTTRGAIRAEGEELVRLKRDLERVTVEPPGKAWYSASRSGRGGPIPRWRSR